MKRILFTAQDFKTLISGGVVRSDDVEIALQDIGYDVMYNLLYQEMYENKHILSEKLPKVESRSEYYISRCSCGIPFLRNSKTDMPDGCFNCLRKSYE